MRAQLSRSWPHLHHRDLRQLARLKRSDRHRDTVGVKAHRYVELEPRGHYGIRLGRRGKGNDPRGRIDLEIDALALFDMPHAGTHRALARLDHRAPIATDPRGICFAQRKFTLHPIADPDLLILKGDLGTWDA